MVSISLDNGSLFNKEPSTHHLVPKELLTLTLQRRED
jgi:hypothetical protein